MSPSSTSEARKRRDARATPEPVTFPEPFILTTMKNVRRVCTGQVSVADAAISDDAFWRDWDGPGWADSAIVLWQPTPPRKVTIELDEDVVRRWAGGPPDDLVLTTDPAAITSACRAALDGDK